MCQNTVCQPLSLNLPIQTLVKSQFFSDRQNPKELMKSDIHHTSKTMTYIFDEIGLVNQGIERLN